MFVKIKNLSILLLIISYYFHTSFFKKIYILFIFFCDLNMIDRNKLQPSRYFLSYFLILGFSTKKITLLIFYVNQNFEQKLKIIKDNKEVMNIAISEIICQQNINNLVHWNNIQITSWITSSNPIPYYGEFTGRST